MTETATLSRLDSLPRFGRRKVAVVVSLLLVLAAAGAALFMAQGIEGQMQDASTSFELRKNARELTISLLGAESAQRGYLITVDEAYLGSFAGALEDVAERTQTLLSLASTDTVQRERIQGILGQIDAKTAELQETVDLARAGDAAAARDVLRTDQGLTLMSEVTRTLDAFIATEDAQLAQRNAGVEQARQWLVVALLSALAGAVMLAFFLFTRSQQELTDLRRAGASLQTINRELEEHVRSRTAELEDARAHSERERERVEALLKDTNHRIGNSLATVSSLLALQMLRSDSEDVKAALEAARNRVHAIASGHRRLRLGEDFETTQADEFLGSVVDDFRETQAGSEIEVETDISPFTINARDATTVGIILGELLTNARKHAFGPGQAGRIHVSFLAAGEHGAVLAVTDTGRGMADKPATEGKSGGLGSVIVRQLSSQFDGSIDYAPAEGGGTRVTVSMPGLGRTHHLAGL